MIVLQALLSLARRALSGWDDWCLALMAFAAMFFLSVPFPIIILGAALWGLARADASAATAATVPPARVPITQTFGTVALWGTLWAAPILLAWAMGASFLTEIALFFSQLAVVTFGGAYAVLAYMTQAVVEDPRLADHTADDRCAGTCGNHAGAAHPRDPVRRPAGGIRTGRHTVGAPCGGADALGHLHTVLSLDLRRCALCRGSAGASAPQGALSGISAAVTGVILNLSVWFALHVLFDTVVRTPIGPRPDLAGFLPLNGRPGGARGCLSSGPAPAHDRRSGPDGGGSGRLASSGVKPRKRAFRFGSNPLC